MLRIVCEVACPSVLLLGEVVMEPAKVAPFSSWVKLPGAVVGKTWGTVFSNSRGISQLS